MWFVPSLAGGGAERVCIDVANAMAKRGFDVTIATAGGAGARRSEVAPGVALVELFASGVGAAIPALARAVRAHRPSTLIAVMDHANLAAWLASRLAGTGVRVVFTTHVDFAHAFGELRGVVRRVVLAAYRSVYRRAYRRVAVSNGVADSIAARLDIARDAISVVHNPIDTRRIRTLAEAQAPAPNRSSDSPLVVAIGRLVLQKDFATLLDAVAIARHRQPLRLAILGEGPERERLTQRAIALDLRDSVQMPGFVSNPYPWMRRSRVFVSSSRFEGFGIAIVEAMALGVPVVATDCPSGPAEILAGGVYGRLVPVGDANALADAICAAIRDPGPIAAALRRADEFDVEAVTDRWVELMAGRKP